MSNVTKLAILGVLMEKDMHGYEIKKHIEERMGDYTDVKFGSIYYSLSSFLEEGYICEAKSKQEPGQVPEPEREKRVYAITEKGKNYFYEIASEELHRSYKHIDPIGVLLNFIYIFPKEEVVESFRNKIQDLDMLKRKALHERTRLMSNPEVPKLIDYLFTHTLHHLNTEIQWMEDFINFVAVDSQLFLHKGD